MRKCSECGVSEVWAYINEHQLCDACWEAEKKRINELNLCKK